MDPGQVRLILATHWDDDHISGLAECVATCRSATFACSAAYVGKEFAALVLAYPPSIPKSGVREMLDCFDVLKERDGGVGAAVPKRVIEDQTTWANQDSTVSVFALAPTSAALMRAEQSVDATLLPNAQRRRSVGQITANQASVVVTVRFPGDAVLLGGDLIERGSGGSGWSAVVANFSDTAPRNSAFKVPHHGSEGAQHDGQWDPLMVVAGARIAVGTSFASRRLPHEAELRWLLDRASAVYLTGGRNEVSTRLTHNERQALRAAGVRVLPSQKLGHVRLRRAIGPAGDWDAELEGNARQITRDDLGTAPRRVKRGRR